MQIIALFERSTIEVLCNTVEANRSVCVINIRKLVNARISLVNLMYLRFSVCFQRKDNIFMNEQKRIHFFFYFFKKQGFRIN